MAKVTDRDRILLEAGTALVSDLSLERVLHRIVELAVEVTDATYGALGVLGSDRTIVDFITTGIDDERRRAIGHLPVGGGLLGLLIRDARSIRIPDIGRDPRSVGFPANHPPMRSFLGAPIKAHGRVYGNLYLTEKRSASEFDAEDERALVALATQAGVAIENAVLYQEALQRQQRLNAVGEINAAILAGTDAEGVLVIVAKRARELAGADLTWVAVPTGDGGSLRIDVADGARADALRGKLVPVDGSASGEAIRTGTSLVLSDATSDDRSYHPTMQLGDVGPAMLVPLIAEGLPFGTLVVANAMGGRPFSDEDLALVEGFADQAAVALEYARARRGLERLAVMDDRERIAKELHDGVIQSLFAVGMGLQAAATMSRDPDIGRRIEASVGEIDRVIRDLRNYIFGLRPGILADRQLDQALRHLAQDFQDKTEIVTVVDVDATIAAELGPRAGDVIQLAREALSNVGRHSGAATCRVSLLRRDGSAVLEVDDDGNGFDEAASAGKGQGMRNLRDRVASMGGTFEVESSSGQGTTVRAIVPL